MGVLSALFIQVTNLTAASNSINSFISPMVTTLCAIAPLVFVGFLILWWNSDDGKLGKARSDKQNVGKTVNARTIVAYVKHFMEHLDELLINLCNSINKAAYFSILFDKAPTYQEIKDGTQKNSSITRGK